MFTILSVKLVQNIRNAGDERGGGENFGLVVKQNCVTLVAIGVFEVRRENGAILANQPYATQEVGGVGSHRVTLAQELVDALDLASGQVATSVERFV